VTLQVAGAAAAAVVLLALLAAAAARRLPRSLSRAPRAVQLVESTCLTPQVTLHLVDVAGRRLLIGAGSGGVTTLADLAVGSPSREACRSAGRCACSSSTTRP
jgi:flagellar biogenesis protein FliO